MKKRLTLHSTQLFSRADAFILKVIDAGVWLGSSSDSCYEINIYLHPTRSILNLIGIIFGFASLPHRATRKLRGSNPECRDAGKKASRQISEHNSGQKHCLPLKQPSTDIQRIDLGRITINVYQSPKRLHANIIEAFENHWTGFRLFLQCYQGWHFDTLRLHAIAYDGILVGDLSASSALRLRPYGGGSLRHTKLGILEQLINAVAIVRYFHKIVRRQILQKPLDHSVMVREETYLDAIYARMAGARGASIISMYSPSAIYSIYEAEAPPYWEARVCQRSNRELGSDDLMRINLYMEARLRDSSCSLTYMGKGLNSRQALARIDGSQISLPDDIYYATVFLHSFDDAQLSFGSDGFSDLYHWTVFTIQKLLRNRTVDIVFIKKHPNVDYKEYPGDKIAIRRLFKRFSSCSRVIWLDPNCNPVCFANAGRSIGITHHGSIAEELVWLNIPVIASRYSPWSNNYRFAYLWEHPRNYEELLSQNMASLKVSHKQTSELMSYIHDSRIKSVVKDSDRWPWIRLLEQTNSRSDGNFFDKYKRASGALSKTNLNSDVIKNLFQCHK